MGCCRGDLLRLLGLRGSREEKNRGQQPCRDLGNPGDVVRLLSPIFGFFEGGAGGLDLLDVFFGVFGVGAE